MEWESINELNAFRLLDVNPLVDEFYEQPLRIEYELNGKIRYEVPDILVIANDIKELWEIRPNATTYTREFIERTKLLAIELPQFGYMYRLAIAEALASEPRKGNVLKLLQFGRAFITEATKEEVRQLVARKSEIHWGDVTSGVFGPTGREAICRLALEGLLQFDIKNHWTDSTVFKWTNQLTKSNGGI